VGTEKDQPVESQVPRLALTDRFVATTKSDERIDYFDARTPGLALRIATTGRKSWCYIFTSPRDQKRARMQFGVYPSTSLAEARRKAIETKALLEDGRDPRDVTAKVEATTIAGLLPLYLAKPHKKTGKPRKSVDEIRRRYERNILPVIGSVRLEDLQRRDVNRVVAPMVARAPIEAARVFEDLRGMVRWALGQGFIERNPIEAMEPLAKAAERERALNETEIKKLWNELPQSLPRSTACQTIIKLCLVTAQRVGEVAGMCRSELDFDRAAWRIPGARTKNGHPHTVPLSDLAIDIIKGAFNETFEEIFPAERGSLPARAVARTIARANKEGRFGIARWSAHDLRRTALTQMAAIGIAPIVLAHIANHVSATKAGVTLKVYAQYDYAKEKREALGRWADRLAEIVP
jgi:integrase